MSLEELITGGRKHAHIYFPPSRGFQNLESAFEKTEYIVGVAHADDDPIAGAIAISKTYGFRRRQMVAIIASASPGTGRLPEYKDFTDDQMIELRWHEQMAAAEVGRYAATVQLGFSSTQIQGMELGNPHAAQEVKETLKIILRSVPFINELSLHSCYDEHATHRALTTLWLEAVRETAKDKRPIECHGYGISSSLSWLPKQCKFQRPIIRPNEVRKTLEQYPSEIKKKDYANAIFGRWLAEGVFSREMDSKHEGYVTCALDYSPVINAPTQLLTELVLDDYMHKIDMAFDRQKRPEERLEAYRKSREILAKDAAP